MVLPRLLKAACAGALLIAATLPVRANTDATATYVINLGGNIIANAKFTLTEGDGAYKLTLNANVSGIAQLIAAGTARANSAGISGNSGLQSEAFDLVTHSGDDTVRVQVKYDAGNVSAFIIDPPIVNNIDRVPIERSQLRGVNDMLAVFIRKGASLGPSICSDRVSVFTGIERFDLTFRYTKDDVATSLRTGYQGPVILCNIRYKPISGHYTTSELTNSLAQDDRILIWYAPLHETGWYIPYRVLLTTSMGDLSMVLTEMSE